MASDGEESDSDASSVALLPSTDAELNALVATSSPKEQPLVEETKPPPSVQDASATSDAASQAVTKKRPMKANPNTAKRPAIDTTSSTSEAKRPVASIDKSPMKEEKANTTVEQLGEETTSSSSKATKRPAASTSKKRTLEAATRPTQETKNSSTAERPLDKSKGSLHPFFAKRTKKQKKETQEPTKGEEEPTRHKQEKEDGPKVIAAAKPTKDPSPQKPALPKEDHSKNDSASGIPDAIVPDLAPTPSNARWVVRRDFLLVRHDTRQEKTKAAAFDLDQTLLLWTCSGWPSKPHHYELWSSKVISKLQHLSDDGYQLVIFSNQGGIRSAVTGKVATKVKGLLDWLATKLQRSLFAIVSTNKKSGFHKPSPQMWQICQEECNRGIKFDVDSSFYVGDSDGSNAEGNDAYQELGVDKEFAHNVGQLEESTLKFYTPQDFFGPSDMERRKELAYKSKALFNYDAPPPHALKKRAALLGGYLQGPIMLVLVGVQGSGKSWFCNELVKTDDWTHLSQDTINKGKPGKREKVERAALESLQNDQCVVIDRMHLDVQQRNYFVQVAQTAQVPVHVVWFNPSRKLVESRVRNRKDHPGGVEGGRGAKMALSFMDKLVPPRYEEGFELVSIVAHDEAVATICSSYRQVSLAKGKETPKDTEQLSLPKSFHLNVKQQDQADDSKEDTSSTRLPSIALGTQKLGKRVAALTLSLAIQNGFNAVDTAPTYKNESHVGEGLAESKQKIFVTIKIPKRATQPQQARDEIMESLKQLQITKADLALLHWPCDFMEAGTMEAVWNELEQMVKEGHIGSLGVSNFSIGALRTLLPLCKSEWPVVNQVERHPLLPEWELLDFCSNHNIVLQAHTSLGHGKDELLQHETISEVAQETNQTAAQLVLKWNLQHGVGIVTKCSSETHMQEIMELQTSGRLDGNAMHKLDSIGMDEKSQHKRFVAPPFMYKKGAPYSWGDRRPSS